MKKIIVIVAIVIFVLIGGVFMLTRDSNETVAPGKSPADTTKDIPATGVDSATSTITYTNDGFSPSTITVSSGTTITIKNDSSKSLQFASNDHPTHTKNPELNGSTIDAGQSQTITVTQTGTNGYHNHLNPSDTGTIVVQ
jgi:plastocyanin